MGAAALTGMTVGSVDGHFFVFIQALESLSIQRQAIKRFAWGFRLLMIA